MKRLVWLWQEWRDGVSRPVFFSAATFNLALIVFAGIWTETAGNLCQAVLNFITTYFGWYYIFTTAGILVLVTWLVCSRYSGIRLGQSHDEPEYSTFAWLAMLFAAGMGMGLVFWGVAEPLHHYQFPPTAPPRTDQAIREGMRFSFFHWGFHPWAVYVVFGLGIALLHFRNGLPLAPRSLLYPLLGNRIYGWIGHTTDAFCTVGTLLGVATSLGLGAMQINAGLTQLTDIAYTTQIQIAVIVVITIIATTSTVSGVSRGIKYLSIVNVGFMLLLLGFVCLAGPTWYQLKLFAVELDDYLLHIVPTSLWIDFRAESDWQANWTLFYWGWWISWSPFVGNFIARISRGRTLREFIIYVLFVPTAINCFWFAVFGGTALHFDRSGGGLGEAVIQNAAMSLYVLLEHLPWTVLLQWMGLLLIVIFFITSSDSGSFVDDMVTSGGNPNPPVANRIFWEYPRALPPQYYSWLEDSRPYRRHPSLRVCHRVYY